MFKSYYIVLVFTLVICSWNILHGNFTGTNILYKSKKCIGVAVIYIKPWLFIFRFLITVKYVIIINIFENIIFFYIINCTFSVSMRSTFIRL